MAPIASQCVCQHPQHSLAFTRIEQESSTACTLRTPARVRAECWECLCQRQEASLAFTHAHPSHLRLTRLTPPHSPHLRLTPLTRRHPSHPPHPRYSTGRMPLDAGNVGRRLRRHSLTLTLRSRARPGCGNPLHSRPNADYAFALINSIHSPHSHSPAVNGPSRMRAQALRGITRLKRHQQTPAERREGRSLRGYPHNPRLMPLDAVPSPRRHYQHQMGRSKGRIPLGGFTPHLPSVLGRPRASSHTTRQRDSRSLTLLALSGRFLFVTSV